VETIGAYEVLEELARGGQGVVLKARHVSSGETVVLKLLLDANVETRERFLREGQTLSSLRHPNLLRVTDMCELPNGTPYMVMEFIRGRNLSDWVRTAGVPDQEALVSVLGSLADTLHYCHEQGLVHRDIKPKNVMIEEGSERVVLVDFGLIKRDRLRAAWSTQDRQSLTSEGSIIGTPEYMPPEQVSVRHGEVDRRSDVYALGAVLYFLLTGEKPFTGVTGINIIVQVLQAEPPDPRIVNPGTSDALAELCRRSMAKDMADRPVSAQAFADTLRGRASAPARGRGHAWGAIALATALAVLAVALGVQSARSDPAPPEARAEPELPEEPSVEQLLEQALAANQEGRLENAAALFRRAAEMGSPEAMSSLGSMLEDGRGVAQDEAQGVEWYRRAAKKGHQAAMVRLGSMLEKGRGVAEDETQAVEWYRRAAKKGNPEGMSNLGSMLEKGRGAVKDETQAVALHRRAAEKGHEAAMVRLGRMLEKGRGVVKDETQAVEWFRRAAKKGDAEGMFELASMLEKGRGVAKDEALAAEWLRRAAEKGNEWAMYDLGQRLEKGQGVPKDEALAAEWMRRAAEEGNEWAMYDLSNQLKEGRGVPKNEALASKWLRRAAEKEHPWAMYDLGMQLVKGQGVPKDESEAAEWFRRATKDADVREHAERELEALGQ
jgi:TPR repeat protein/predicted Ser/Thr protein kinase